TGESIVIAPSQTLTNRDYHHLREVSIGVIRHLGIVGECNIQFALDPLSEEYRIIEVNARLSRSSALASKATGYPLAFVAAKLSLGYSLTDIKNSVTKVTAACFEPALDYLVVKIPRWDLKKFRRVSTRIGTGMKSVGEIMSIGRTFEEAIQKAVRMLGTGMDGVIAPELTFDDLEEELTQPTDQRLFAVTSALMQGYSVERIHELTKIDTWFLSKLSRIVDLYKALKAKAKGSLKERGQGATGAARLGSLDGQQLLTAKQHGFSDKQLASLFSVGEQDVRALREAYNIRPSVKQIDTLAAEYPARTNYLYLTYRGSAHDVTFGDSKPVIVLGGGAYRIGSSVEFDWCCVNSALTLRKLKHQTIIINCNPETVSTDYDESDRLYFEDLSYETVLDICALENPHGVIVSMGGQIPNNLVMPLHRAGIPILGTSPESIDSAENRYKFSKLLDDLGVDQPDWKELTDMKDATGFANDVGYPVLVRPSYVLSGAAMSIAFSDAELEEYLSKAAKVNPEHPVVISKFLTNAKEIEVDAVAANGDLVISAITEHVENAGVHSGDATMVFPPQKLYLETIKRVRHIATQVAKSLCITGPFNIQFLAKDNDIKVIELNLRASRSFPFVSKVSRYNFIDLATRAIMGRRVPMGISTLDLEHVGVKAPQFSFSRLKGADPVVTVEMASTGEVACLGHDLHDALLKSLIATGMEMPSRKAVLVSVSGDANRYKFLDSIRDLQTLGFTIYATYGTHLFLKDQGISSTFLHKIHEMDTTPNIREYLNRDKIDLVINLPARYSREELDDEYEMRRRAVDYGIPLFTNLQLAKLFVESIVRLGDGRLSIDSWDTYKT
ncbi:carbamoyl phosphate synthase large subunit, partial [Candidatus Woesearchaeota archaeon CG_4_10_14_0_2_um_filter_57_5]